MEDILLFYSDTESVERMFEEVKKLLPSWELQISPGKNKTWKIYKFSWI